MAGRSGGTPIRTRKVTPGPDQAFTLPKGTSAAPIKNVPVKVKAKTKTETKTKTKSEPKKIKAKTKTETKTKTKTKTKPKKGRKSLGWRKPTAFAAGVGAGGTAAALLAIGRSQDKYRKYRK